MIAASRSSALIPGLVRLSRIHLPVDLVALLAGALALAIRSYHIGVQSIWFDETFSLMNARTTLAGVFDATRSDVHPPLYYLLLHAWLGVRQSDGWARLLSAGFCAVTVVLTYVAAWRLLGNRAIAVCAALLLAIAPANVALGQEARMYPLLSLLSIASLVSFEYALRRDSLLSWAIYAVVCGLVLWTQYYGFFVVAAHGLAALVVAWRRWKLLAHAWVALVVSGLLFVPWIPSFLTQFRTARTAFWVPPFDADEVHETIRQLAIYSSPDHGSLSDPLTVCGTYLVAALALAGAVLVIVRHRHAILIPLLVVVPIFIAAAVSVRVVSIYTPRYLLFTQPAFILLVAIGLWDLKAWWRAGALVVVSAAMFVSLQTWFEDTYYMHPDFRQAAHQISASFEPGDVILHSSPYSSLPTTYYTAGRFPTVELGSNSREHAQQIGHDYHRLWLVRIEDTAAWGATVNDEVADFMADLTLIQKWPLLGAALYLYQSPYR